MKVMVVDDEASIRLLVRTVVEADGYTCCCVQSGVDALKRFEEERPNIVVLDVMMPEVDGFEVCRRIRSIDQNVPILFLSAKSDIVDKKVGFATGGDDYLVKPFDEEELIMRIEALIRRSMRSASTTSPERFTKGCFVFDAVRHEVKKNNCPVALTPKEFQLLYLLASHEGAVMSKDELVETAWGQEYIDDAISIAVYVRKLREKIEDDPAKPQHLKTVWGVGYVFEA